MAMFQTIDKLAKMIGWCLIPALVLASCTPPVPYHPHVTYVPPPQSIRSHRSAFPPLSCEEQCQDWGKELKIALAFAAECDYYRAITSFKRALVLVPPAYFHRKEEIEYDIVLSYYLGQKYQQALEAFEGSCLVKVNQEFPTYHDLLIILYDCIQKTGNTEGAKRFLPLIEQICPRTAQKLELGTEVSEGCFAKAMQLPQAPEYFCDAYRSYLKETKSIDTARLLNAVLPGTGYWYVGQDNTAITALIVNALFVAASYQFFRKHQYAAGVITASLEMGWYLGGIYGGGRAAAEWNEQKYAAFGEKIMCQESLFPQLMLRFAF